MTELSEAIFLLSRMTDREMETILLTVPNHQRSEARVALERVRDTSREIAEDAIKRRLGS